MERILAVVRVDEDAQAALHFSVIGLEDAIGMVWSVVFMRICTQSKGEQLKGSISEGNYRDENLVATISMQNKSLSLVMLLTRLCEISCKPFQVCHGVRQFSISCRGFVHLILVLSTRCRFFS